MSDIPEGLLQAVDSAIKDAIRTHGMDGDMIFWMGEHEKSEERAILARAAILAQNAWYDEQNRRVTDFVEFRGPNPRGKRILQSEDFYAWKGEGPAPGRWTAPDGAIVYRDYGSYVDD